MQCKSSRLFVSRTWQIISELNQTKHRLLQTSSTRLQFIEGQQLDLEYITNRENWNEIERNVRLRRKTTLLNELIGAKTKLSDEQFQNWIKENAVRLPNRLHSRWTTTSDQDATKDKDEFVLRSFGAESKPDVNARKAELLFRLKGWLQLPQHEQIGFVGGNRSYVMLDELCQLRDAIVSFTMDQLVKRHGFTRVVVPNLLYEQTVAACGFATRSDRSQVYTVDGMTNVEWQKNLLSREAVKKNKTKVKTQSVDGDDDSDVQSEGHSPFNNGADVCLAGTAEISLAALHFSEQLEHDRLPLKYCAVSRCYRAEVSPRADEGGLYRVHYFDKVEMFAFTDPAESDQMLRQFVDIQQDLFTRLGLQGRVLDMPPHELGSSANRKYDVEVYLPGRQLFGELSSASNCTDFQSRRLNVFSRRLAPDFASNEPFDIRHVHTVNGTAVAVPRMLIALAETHQTPDGDIAVPEVLRPYLNNRTVLDRRNNCFVGKKKHQEQLNALK
jgi:seryl-tRNA synthetase